MSLIIPPSSVLAPRSFSPRPKTGRWKIALAFGAGACCAAVGGYLAAGPARLAPAALATTGASPERAIVEKREKPAENKPQQAAATTPVPATAEAGSSRRGPDRAGADTNVGLLPPEHEPESAYSPQKAPEKQLNRANQVAAAPNAVPVTPAPVTAVPVLPATAPMPVERPAAAPPPVTATSDIQNNAGTAEPPAAATARKQKRPAQPSRVSRKQLARDTRKGQRPIPLEPRNYASSRRSAPAAPSREGDEAGWRARAYASDDIGTAIARLFGGPRSDRDSRSRLADRESRRPRPSGFFLFD